MTQESQFQVPPHESSQPPRTEVAKEQGQQVADRVKAEASTVTGDARREGRHVASTAKHEARDLADTAGTHAQRVMDQAKTELDQHASTQQERLAGSIRALADELTSMVDSSNQSGPVNDLAQQAAGKAGDVASWLESRGPGDVLDDVRRYAARKPGMFLAIAAGAGLLAGRLTRGLASDGRPSRTDPSSSATPTAGYPPVRPSTLATQSPPSVSQPGGLPPEVPYTPDPGYSPPTYAAPEAPYTPDPGYSPPTYAAPGDPDPHTRPLGEQPGMGSDPIERGQR